MSTGDYKSGIPIICGHCGRPIGSFNDDDKLVYVGQTPYHYKCTQPPKTDTTPAYPGWIRPHRPQYYRGGTYI
jgi:hypothetical protein